MTERSNDDGIKRRSVLKAAAATGTVGVTSAGLSESATAERGPLAGFGGTACKTPRTSDENLPFDTEEEYGGWGGHEYHCTEPGLDDQNPIVFVHGNTHDACDFAEHATEYLYRGYNGDALWSITFRKESSTHPEMRDQLDDFVSNVRSYTDAKTVDIVSHSLGVTGARFWMDDLDRYDWVDTFVGCAGANHGTYTCGPGCEPGTGTARPCGFISPDCADDPGDPLYELNHPDETPGDVEYYTIRGGADYFYLENPDSPKLAGATENVLLEDSAHNATRASETSISLMFQWVTDGDLQAKNDSGPSIAATGSREDDGGAFTAGQTNQVELSVEASRPAIVRDRVPYEWDVVVGESTDASCVAPHPHEGTQHVYFEGKTPRKRHELAYFIEAPDSIEDSKTYQFGPVEVRAPSGGDWQTVPGTQDTNTVVGASTDT